MKYKRKSKEEFLIKYQHDNTFRIMSLCLIILFLGVMSASVAHAESYKFVTKWGSYGNGAGQFHYPRAIVATSSGYIYVADSGNNRVQEFNSNGKFINQWSSTNDVSLGSVNGVAIDSSGDVYVADTNNRIVKFDKNGNFITKFGSYGSGNVQFKNARDICLDSSGNIYVADTGNNRIQKLDNNGNYLVQWGSYGSSNGQFKNPIDVALDSLDNVYVADKDNHCIKKFDSNGNYLMQFGNSGNGDGQFNNIISVFVDSSGNIYVSDRGNTRIQKFDSDGNYLTHWGSYGTNDGQFKNPEDIGVDSSGNVYVADADNNRIQKFAPVYPPVTNFVSNVTTGYAPLAVKFTDTSTGTPFSWTWNFGDGTFSTVKNPTHTYSKAGKYTVKLTATNEGGNSTAAKTNYITVKTTTVKPVAIFSASPTSGKAPLKVTFTDKSTGSPTKWKWNFGDGSKSFLQNPSHKYSKAGKYTVSLTVKNDKGSNTVTKTNYLTVVAKPVAAFSASPTSGKAPLKVTFTDKSTGSPTKWKWNFGDGTTSAKQNPIHKYSKAGKYKVTLTVANAAGINTVTKTNYITVIAKPAAAFSASPTSGKAPLKVTFSDKSTGTPTKWKWTFGDGSKSFLQNPTHKYSKAGKYKVILTVTNTAGSNTVTKTNYITVVAKPVAAFSASPTSGKAPLKVTFSDKSTGTPTKWKWNFGDGATSIKQNPVHKYSNVGSYTVKLTVTNAAGSNTKTISNYIILKSK